MTVAVPRMTVRQTSHDDARSHGTDATTRRRRPTMTLRLRLVVALLALLTVGMTTFGVVVTSFYARSQYQRLDERLRSSAGFATARLRAELGLDTFRPRPTTTPGDPTPPRATLGPDAWVQLRSTDGDVVGTGTFSSTDSTDPTDNAPAPALPATLDVSGSDQRFLTVGSSSGDGQWRVLVTPADRFSGLVGLVAVPTSDVSGPIRRLVIIEVLAGGALLALLGGGAWLIMRRGLRPLEQMAASARAIDVGTLRPGPDGTTQVERVTPADPQSEVGQLGLAINTMLGEVEEAFSERDATEQRLRRFLADASHELRTPLTSIQGFAELFRMGAADDPERLAVIMRRIEEEAQRMGVLVEDLLLLARLDRTRTPGRDAVDLTVLVADACTDAAATAPDRPITLVAPEPVVVDGVGDHLRQALANLVTNALRHTPAGSPIEVGVRREPTDAVIWVRDHGPGFDAGALDHAFERFWQADASRTGNGTGLGLAIVAAIAAEHGGTVTATNGGEVPGGTGGTHNGGGATVSLHLPLRPEAGPAMEGAS